MPVANPAVGFDKASEKTSLFVRQLTSGIAVQKYETSIRRDGASPAVNYLDPAGRKLLDRICKDGPIESVPGYLRAVLRYPIDFLGVYGRHFINGLDVRDGRAYVTRPSAGKSFAAFGCITLLMVLLLAIRSGPSLRAQPDRGILPLDWMWPAVLVMPALVIIPGAMETRFMLPLMLYLFAAASTGWSGAAIASRLRAHPYFYLPLALAVYAVFFAVTLNTMANVAQATLPAEAWSCPGT